MNKALREFKDEILFLLKYLLSPYENFSEKLPVFEKWRIFTIVFIAELLFLILVTGPLFYIADLFVNLKEKKLLVDYNIYGVLLLGAVIIPIIEEVIFRLPLQWNGNYFFRFFNVFSQKNVVYNFWKRFYPWFFYLFAIVFGLVHLKNYENNKPFLFILFSPFIVSSQLLGGFVLGYIRNRLGFWWSVLFHGLHNLLALLIPYLVYHNTKVLGVSDSDKRIYLTELVAFEGAGKNFYVDEKKGRIYKMKIKNTDFQELLDHISPGLTTDQLELVNFELSSKNGVTKQQLLNILKTEVNIKSQNENK